MRAEDITESLALFMKENGYKKNRLNWYKDTGDVTLVFAVQKSQYGADVWYYTFGTGINALADGIVNTASKCCIRERLVNTVNGKPLTAEVLQKAILRWEERFGDIVKLRKAAIEGRLPAITEKRAVTYLTTVHFRG